MDQHFATRKCRFPGLWDEGFNWDRLRRFIAGYQPPSKPVPARSGTYTPSPRRLATKSSGSGMKSPPDQSRSAPNARTRVWGGGESFGLRRKTIKHPEQPMLLPVGLYHL